MLKNLPQKVKIVEVGPRDGLQNEKLIVPTEDKVKFILLLGESGLKNIEVTSFVRPDRIPQMTDAKQVIEALQKTDLINTVNLSCLIPNLKGLEAASKLGIKEIAVFSSTSDTFNKKNINSTVEESLTIIRPVLKEALELNIRVRAYISTVFGCPYEGKPKSLDTLKRMVDFFVEAGAYELSLSDTIGYGNPKEVVNVLESLKDSVDRKNLAMHMHDTRGLALSNILTGLEMGISTFDGSSGGLGGCPYAKGASGNCATEELVYLFESMGISTGVDINKLKEASSFALEKLERKSPSKFLQAYKS